MRVRALTSRRPAAARARARPAVAILLTAAVSAALAHEGHAPLPTKGARVDVAKGRITLSRDARDALDARTAEVATRTVTESILAYATVVTPWQRHAFASSRLAGRVASIAARPGQRVEAGQVLAEVESVALESLRLEFLTARTDIALSEKLVGDLEEATRSGAVAVQTLLDAEVKLRQQRIALDIARAKWIGLGLPADALDVMAREGRPVTGALPVRSPIGGTVIHADVAVGRVIDPSEHLFEVVDLSTVWVQVGVLEQDLHRVAVGQAVELRLSAHPGEVFQTSVQAVGQYLDPVTHLNAVWAELPNPAGAEPRLLPGMSGEARILLPGSPGTAVPAAALIREGAERYVLVEEAVAKGASEFLRRNVVPGREADGWVEDRSQNLFPGDRVVTRGSHELAGFLVPGVLRLSPEAGRSIGLAVEPAAARAVEEVIDVDGAVDLPPDHRAAVSSPLAGTLVRVLADRGQAVKAGDVLAEVFNPDLQDVQSDLLRTHLEGTLLEETLRRLQQAGSAVQRRRLLEAEAQLASNRQQQDVLRRKLRVLGFSDPDLSRLVTDRRFVESLPLRSPIGGVVASFDRALGQAVKAEEPLFVVHDLSRPLVQGYLSGRELGRVTLGQAARVRVTADPGFLAEGTVARSGRVLGPESRTLSVWVELSGELSRPLRHNQLARLTLTVRRPEPTLAVPRTATIAEGSRVYVFVRGPEGVFERRAVRTGRRDDRFVEVTGGLRAGEPVVVRGAAELQTAYAGLR